MAMEQKDFLNEIVDSLPKQTDFLEVYENIFGNALYRKLKSWYDYFALSKQTTLEELVWFYKWQGETFWVDTWKTDWKILEAVLKEDTKKQELFLKFIDDMKKLLLEFRKEHWKNYYEIIPSGADLASLDFYDNLLEIANNKKDDHTDNDNIVIDYEWKSVEINLKEIKEYKKNILEDLDYFKKTNFYEKIFKLQAKFILNLNKTDTITKWRKKTMFNFNRAFVRLSFEFNNLFWWVTLEDYIKYNTKEWELDKEELLTRIMPNDYVLTMYQFIAFIDTIYWNATSEDNKYLKNSPISKFITIGSDNVLAKLYLFNWIQFIYKPIALYNNSNATLSIKETIKETLELIQKTTSINTIEEWHLKSLSNDFFFFGIIRDLADIYQSQQENLPMGKINEIRNLMGRIIVKKNYNIDNIFNETSAEKETQEAIDEKYPLEHFKKHYAMFMMLPLLKE